MDGNHRKNKQRIHTEMHSEMKSNRNRDRMHTVRISSGDFIDFSSISFPWSSDDLFKLIKWIESNPKSADEQQENGGWVPN